MARASISSYNKPQSRGYSSSRGRGRGWFESKTYMPSLDRKVALRHRRVTLDYYKSTGHYTSVTAGQVRTTMAGRSKRSQLMDRGKQAKRVGSLSSQMDRSQWYNQPGRMDLRGIDTKVKPKYRVPKAPVTPKKKVVKPVEPKLQLVEPKKKVVKPVEPKPEVVISKKPEPKEPVKKVVKPVVKPTVKPKPIEAPKKPVKPAIKPKEEVKREPVRPIIMRKPRPSPSISATSVDVGTVRTGGDGNLWEARAYKRGDKTIQHWVRYDGAKKPEPSVKPKVKPKPIIKPKKEVKKRIKLVEPKEEPIEPVVKTKLVIEPETELSTLKKQEMKYYREEVSAKDYASKIQAYRKRQEISRKIKRLTRPPSPKKPVETPWQKQLDHESKQINRIQKLDDRIEKQTQMDAELQVVKKEYDPKGVDGKDPVLYERQVEKHRAKLKSDISSLKQDKNISIADNKIKYAGDYMTYTHGLTESEFKAIK